MCVCVCVCVKRVCACVCVFLCCCVFLLVPPEERVHYCVCGVIVCCGLCILHNGMRGGYVERDNHHSSCVVQGSDNSNHVIVSPRRACCVHMLKVRGAQRRQVCPSITRHSGLKRSKQLLIQPGARRVPSGHRLRRRHCATSFQCGNTCTRWVAVRSHVDICGGERSTQHTRGAHAAHIRCVRTSRTPPRATALCMCCRIHLPSLATGITRRDASQRRYLEVTHTHKPRREKQAVTPHHRHGEESQHTLHTTTWSQTNATPRNVRCH